MAKNNILTTQETKKEALLGAVPIVLLIVGLLVGLGLGYFIGYSQVKNPRLDGKAVDVYTGEVINER